MEKNCKNCGKKFTDKSTNQVAVWCTDKCRHQFRRKQNPPPPKKIVQVQDTIDLVLNKIKDDRITPFDRIKPFKYFKTIKGDEEEMVVVLSDWQLGHKTISFNYEIAEKRVKYLLEKTIKIAQLHRQASPIKKLNIFILGDMVQSEKVGYLVDLSELEYILFDQIYKEAVPLLSWFIAECAKYFENVSVNCVRGNHGRGEKGSSDKTNWDDVIYKTLEIKFANNPQVKFNIAREFYQIVDVMGWKFLLAHGDQVKGGSYGIPLYAMLQRMLRWASSMPTKWDAICFGHWHCYGNLEQNGQELIVNGTLVSDDEYVRKMYGWNSSTVQVVFGVHPRHKIAWLRKINLLNMK